LPNVHFSFNPLTAVNGMEYLMGWENQTPTGQLFLLYCFYQLDPVLPLLTLLGMAAAIGAISFYASTLARNTLQALAPAVLGLVLTVFLNVVVLQPDDFGIHFPWRGWLIYFTGVPVFLITLVALAFGNFKPVNIGGKVWLRNVFVFAAALAFVVVTTSTIYHRAWEKLTPFDPSHGAARLSLSNPATLTDQWNSFSVHLPDGRIWTDNYTSRANALNPFALLLGDVSLTSLGGGHFYEGSNWVSMVGGTTSELVGVKNDGALWVSKNPARRERLGRWKITKADDLVQFGDETNWSSVVMTGLSVLLVKNDGTLWRLGTTNWNFKNGEWPGLRAFTPYRLGTESNWAEAFLADNQLRLRKNDGSLWTGWGGNQTQKIELEPWFSVRRLTLVKHGQWRGTTTMGNGPDYNLGVRSDGTFRLWADQKLNKLSNDYEWTAVDLQFGTETNWLGVAGRSEKVVTLKNDGSLWVWNFHHDNRRGWDPARDEREMLDAKPVRLGTHSDWIGVTSADGGIISLAADGSLWYWPLEDAAYYLGELGNYNNNAGNSHFEPLLDVSRKPQLLGNVFSNKH
jgi:hypothetical protein